MSLRTQAADDFRKFSEDINGFGWPVTITDPAGVSTALTGFTNDISQVIDPETGQVVSGRTATVVFSLQTLRAAGVGMPKGINDAAVTPWLVQFTDPSLNAFIFKISRTDPDRTIESITCFLELYAN